MRRWLFLVVAAFAGSGVLAPGATAEVIAGRYIVVLDDTVEDPSAVAAKHERKYGADPDGVYRHALNGYVADVPSSELDALRSDPAVAFVAEDRAFARPPSRREHGAGLPGRVVADQCPVPRRRRPYRRRPKQRPLGRRARQRNGQRRDHRLGDRPRPPRPQRRRRRRLLDRHRRSWTRPATTTSSATAPSSAELWARRTTGSGSSASPPARRCGRFGSSPERASRDHRVGPGLRRRLGHLNPDRQGQGERHRGRQHEHHRQRGTPTALRADQPRPPPPRLLPLDRRRHDLRGLSRQRRTETSRPRPLLLRRGPDRDRDGRLRRQTRRRRAVRLLRHRLRQPVRRLRRPGVPFSNYATKPAERAPRHRRARDCIISTVPPGWFRLVPTALASRPPTSPGPPPSASPARSAPAARRR